MTEPLVSVCLPNLNTLPYLQARVESIFAQTYTNWELIVSDNFSDDGAWEFFERLSQRDSRVSIAQAPREGLYPNWNNCLRRAQGKYVYIATSDDTMAPDCLEKMTAALEKHSECDLAHCPLVFIDRTGTTADDPKWPQCAAFADGIGAIANLPHIRRAPYDGLMHLGGKQVVTSITQLLIRRSLFARTGTFSSRWGSTGDFNWEMKAGLLGSMVHVPDTWATWRVHPTQATASVDWLSPERSRMIEEMIQDAVDTCTPFLAPGVLKGMRQHWLQWSKDVRTYYAALCHRHGSVRQKRFYQVKQLFNGTKAARSELIRRIAGRPQWTEVAPVEIRDWLESIGVEGVITQV